MRAKSVGGEGCRSGRTKQLVTTSTHVATLALPMSMSSQEKADRMSEFARDLADIDDADVIVAAFWINPGA
jgi:hypothetical protein